VKRLYLALVACLACADAPTEPSRLMTAQSVVADGTYIVVFRNEVQDVPGLVRSLAVRSRHQYQHAIKGFAGPLTADELDRVRRHPLVQYVERDAVATITDEQLNPPSWGLDRIDQRLRPLDQRYRYTESGVGAVVYIIDTGILFGHAEFEGRAVSGYDFIDLDADASDCSGHGTHVAGTVGGRTVGVAKAVRLVSVRVLNCQGSGEYSQVIAGIDYVAGQPDAARAIANLSLGGPYSQATNDAVARATAKGVVVVVASGNGGADACLQSPAASPSAITVGATNASDVRSSWSNYGPCVDLHAPGDPIYSSLISGGYGTKGGTSMAAPHVAGVAARYRSVNPTASMQAVTDTILRGASPLVTNLPANTTPLLLYSVLTGGGEAPPPGPTPPPPPPPPPTSAVHGGNLFAVPTQPVKKGDAWAFLSWGAYVHGANHEPIAGVQVQMRINGASGVSTCTSQADGACVFLSSIRLPKGNRPFHFSFAVVAMILPGASYAEAVNHDPDGSSDGSTMTVRIR
jgi:subtilisin family serine protease